MTEPFGYTVKPFAGVDFRAHIEMALWKRQMETRLRVSEAWLAAGWVADLHATQEIGASWHAGRRSAILRVPSSVDDREFNWTLNPDHPDFSAIRFGTPEPYRFDSRLKP